MQLLSSLDKLQGDSARETAVHVDNLRAQFDLAERAEADAAPASEPLGPTPGAFQRHDAEQADGALDELPRLSP